MDHIRTRDSINLYGHVKNSGILLQKIKINNMSIKAPKPCTWTGSKHSSTRNGRDNSRKSRRKTIGDSGRARTARGRREEEGEGERTARTDDPRRKSSNSSKQPTRRRRRRTADDRSCDLGSWSCVCWNKFSPIEWRIKTRGEE